MLGTVAKTLVVTGGTSALVATGACAGIDVYTSVRRGVDNVLDYFFGEEEKPRSRKRKRNRSKKLEAGKNPIRKAANG